jgi:alkylhydroperoxidase family enzyme
MANGPRLTPITPQEMSGSQKLLVELAAHNGAPDPLVASIFVKSEIGRLWLRTWNEVLNGGTLPVPLKEMCRVLISTKHFCGYCSTVRSRVAKENGLTEEKLMAIFEFEKSPILSAREKAALRFATRFKQGDDGIDADEVFADLKAHFSEDEIIELALLCGETDGVGKFARSLNLRSWEEACAIQPRLQDKPVVVAAE